MNPCHCAAPRIYLVAPMVDGRPSPARTRHCSPCALAIDAAAAPGAMWIVRLAAAPAPKPWQPGPAMVAPDVVAMADERARRRA